jgi:vacuolar-type H+-ATPase subunit I/STV1
MQTIKLLDFEWFMFLAQLPATPSSLRVTVWRRLRAAGAASLQNGVWLLPRNDENALFMERLLAFVKENGASGQIFLVQGLNQVVQEDILARFEADREQEYDEFLEQCDEFIAEIEKETSNQKFTFAELEENEQNLQRLRKWITKIQKRDFINGEKAGDAIKVFRNCRQALKNFTRKVYAQEGIEMLEEDLTVDEEGLDQEAHNER